MWHLLNFYSVSKLLTGVVFHVMSSQHSLVWSDMGKSRSGSKTMHKQHCQDFATESFVCLAQGCDADWLLAQLLCWNGANYGALSQHICSTFWPETWRTATRSSSPLVVERPLPDLSFCCPVYCLPTSRFEMTKLEIESLKAHVTVRHCCTLHFITAIIATRASVKGVGAWLKSNVRLLHQDCIISDLHTPLPQFECLPSLPRDTQPFVWQLIHFLSQDGDVASADKRID